MNIIMVSNLKNFKYSSRAGSIFTLLCNQYHSINPELSQLVKQTLNGWKTETSKWLENIRTKFFDIDQCNDFFYDTNIGSKGKNK